MTALAGGLLLVPGSTPLASADPGSGLHLLAYGIVGNQVEVYLLNSGDAAANGSVILEVQVGGVMDRVELPFSVSGRQRVTIRWVSSAPVERIHRVGIIVDDGTPY